MICAVVGGTVFVLQFLLTLLGFGGGHDVDTHGIDVQHAGAEGHADGSSWLFGMISFRAVVAALTSFGLGGLAGVHSNIAPLASLGVAAGCSLTTMLCVALLTRILHGLEEDGTAHIQQAVGQSGTVYIDIPAGNAGTGKVTVSLQNRTMEYEALTHGPALPTGARVIVVRVMGSDTVEVAAAPA